MKPLIGVLSFLPATDRDPSTLLSSTDDRRETKTARILLNSTIFIPGNVQTYILSLTHLTENIMDVYGFKQLYYKKYVLANLKSKMRHRSINF